MPRLKNKYRLPDTIDVENIVEEKRSPYGLRTYVSLFSSAGVGCYGFKEEGFYCIATVELLERRLKIQKFNNKCAYNSGYICGDMTSQETKDKVHIVISAKIIFLFIFFFSNNILALASCSDDRLKRSLPVKLRFLCHYSFTPFKNSSINAL